MANPRMQVCARKWKRPSSHLASTYPAHMSKCLKKGGKSASARKSSGGKRSTCSRECTQKVANRIRSGDKTPKATMRAVCMRKCSERKISAPAAAVAAAPAPVKRDISALCARYSSNADVRARCVAGEVGPGRLVAKLAGSAPSASFARTPEYRLAKRMRKAQAKRRGMIRKAALRMKRGGGRFVLRSPFGTGRKTIGRKRN